MGQVGFMDINQIQDYHIHIYYDENSIGLAKTIGHEASIRFGLILGNFHEKKVGPHPRWSVQLLIPKIIFSEVLSWLALNRQGLTVFTHPNTGRSLEDHKDHAIWMGELLELNLNIFE